MLWAIAFVVVAGLSLVFLSGVMFLHNSTSKDQLGMIMLMIGGSMAEVGSLTFVGYVGWMLIESLT